ncbi:MAG: ATP-binding protein [Bacteroidota bacterium]
MVLSENQKLRIPSRAENIILVERMVEDVCDLYNIGEDYYGNILIAITEAVNNAIYHGNAANPTKSIDILFKTHKDHVSFIVKDEGQGFDFSNLPDPTNPDNIDKPNGRGVFLMRNLADKVSFEDNGSTVILDFNVITASK